MTAGEITAEQPAGIGRENPYFDNPAARRLVDELLKAGDGRTGDHLSAAIRAITSSASSLPVDQVDAAIAAIALLLAERAPELLDLSLIHISEPTRRTPISYAVFCLKKKKTKN